MDLYVMDHDFNQYGIIENSESVMWRKCYCDAGSFELYTIASDEYVALLQMGRYIIRRDDDMIGIIEKINMQVDEDGRDMLLASGRCAKALFARRIIMKQTTFTGTVYDRMCAMLNDNAVNPPDAGRVIPRTKIIADASCNVGTKGDTQHTGTNLMQAVCELLASNKCGWKVTQDGEHFNVMMTAGVNRTIEQSTNSPIIFSDSLDNLISSDYIRDISGYANVARIGGEGEGDKRVWAGIDITGTASGTITGLNRYELYVDARDLQSKSSTADGKETTMTAAQYTAVLQARGMEKLAGTWSTQSFEGEVDIGSYKYRTDYDVGDMVTIRDRHGITANVRITAVEEFEDSEGYTVTPTFGDYTIIA